MNENKINIMLMLICIFLCICTICISIAIPKCIIEKSNDVSIVKYGDYNYYVYGDTFYATIEKIKNYDGATYIYVKGLEINDINHRGEYYFKVDDDTELIWRYVKKSLSELKEGQTISITSVGAMMKNTGLLNKVTRVTLLEDEI